MPDEFEQYGTPIPAPATPDEFEQYGTPVPALRPGKPVLPDPVREARGSPMVGFGELTSGLAYPFRQIGAKLDLNEIPEPPQTATAKAGTAITDTAAGVAATLLAPELAVPAWMGYSAATAPPGQELSAARTGFVTAAAPTALSKTMGMLGRRGASTLVEHNIQPTPGQFYSGLANWIEQAAESLPIVGTAVKQARQRPIEEFSRTALQATGVPAKELKGLAPDQALDVAQKYVDDIYEHVKPLLKPTQEGATAIGRNAMHAMTNPLMTDAQRSAVQSWIDQKLGNYGAMDGEALKALDSELGYLARAYGKSPNPGDRPLGAAFQAVQDGLREGFHAALPPEASAALKAADKGYRELLALEKAAGQHPEEVVRPRALQRTLAQRDRQPIPRLFGDQAELAEAGSRVLGPTLANSGTADRLLQTAATVAAFNDPALLLYGPPTFLAAKALTSRPMARVLTGGPLFQNDTMQAALMAALRGWAGRRQEQP